MKSRNIIAVAAIVLAGTAAPALAQDTTTTTADPYAANTANDDNDRDFPWGLLGLAGLAGLLGRKRDHDDTRRTGSSSGTNNRM